MPHHCTIYKNRIQDMVRNNTFPSAMLALLIIALLLLAVYWTLYQDQTVLLGRADLWGQFAPMAFYLDHALSMGDWPQWNPLVFCGVPFAANPQSASYYPPHLIRALLNSSPTPLSTFKSIAWMQTLHLGVLGLGIYLLCRRFRLSWLASVAAACAVVLSSTITYRAVQHWSFIALAAHFPWQFMALHSLLQAKAALTKLRWALLLGILTAHSVLIGSPQILIYPIFCLGAFALLYRLGPGRPAMTWNAWSSTLINDALLALVALLVTLGLSAALLIPAAEFASYCARAKSFATDEAMANAVLVPQLHSPSTLFAAFIQYSGMNSLRFLGLIGAMLTLCALFYKRNWNLFLFALLFMLMFDMALGPPMPIASLASWLVPFYLSEPERAMLIGIVILAVLLGMGIDATIRPLPGTLSPSSRASLLVVLGAFSTLVLFKTLQDDPTSHSWMWALPAIAIASLALAQFPRFASFGTHVTVCILLTHLVFSARDYAQTLANSNLYPENISALNKPAQWPLDNSRTIAAKMLENTGIFRLQAAANGYDPLIPETLDTLLRAENSKSVYDSRISAEDLTRENTLGHNLLKRRFHLAKAYSIETFPDRDEVNFLPSHVVFLADEPQQKSALTQAEEKSWMDALEPMQNQPTVERNTDGSFRVEPIQNDTRHRIAEIVIQNNGLQEAQVSTTILTQGKSILSMVWNLAPGEKTQKRIPLPDSPDIRLQFTLSPDAAADAIEIISTKTLVDSLDSPENITIAEANSDSVSVQIQNNNEASFLFFSEYAYPGWNAYLDGAITPIYPANVAFQAIKIPPGPHEVRFEFDSPTIRYGLRISLATSIITVFLLLLLWRIESKTRLADIAQTL